MPSYLAEVVDEATFKNAAHFVSTTLKENQSEASARETLDTIERNLPELFRDVEKGARLGIAGVSGAAAAVTIGGIAALHGLYAGYESGKRGKSQFESLKVQASDLPAAKEVAVAANGSGSQAVG